MKRITTIVAGILLLSAGYASAADSIREGQWEITSQTDMPGMPMKMPATTIKHCYTKEDVKDHRKVVNQDKNCKVTDYKVSGNKVTWAMQCTGEHEGTFNGETTFSTNAYSSIMKMKSQGYSMTVNVKGKRIGDCPKK